MSENGNEIIDVAKTVMSHGGKNEIVLLKYQMNVIIQQLEPLKHMKSNRGLKEDMSVCLEVSFQIKALGGR